MIGFLKEYWPMWLLLFIAGTILMRVLGKNRTREQDREMATTSEQFSMKSVFFSYKRGEAVLFFTIAGATVSFFLFVLGIIAVLFDFLSFL